MLLLREFHFGHKVTSNICSTISNDIHSSFVLGNTGFKYDNLELDDLPRSGKVLEVDFDVLKQLIEEDSRLTAQCLTEPLECVHITVETHLKELDKTWKYDV